MAEPASPDKRPLQEALERSERASVGDEQAAPDAEFFCVRVAGTLYGIESGLIREVVRIPPVTPLPGAPPFLSGVAAVRGDVVAVLDLARFLGKGQVRGGSRSRMAIARSDGLDVGVLADEVVGLVRHPASALHPAPLGSDAGAEFVAGVVMGENPLNVLDLRRALATARARATSRK